MPPKISLFWVPIHTRFAKIKIGIRYRPRFQTFQIRFGSPSEDVYRRGSLLVNIFWTHKNCLRRSILAFWSPNTTHFLTSLHFLCHFTGASMFKSLFFVYHGSLWGSPFLCCLHFKAHLLHMEFDVSNSAGFFFNWNETKTVSTPKFLGKQVASYQKWPKLANTGLAIKIIS